MHTGNLSKMQQLYVTLNVFPHTHIQLNENANRGIINYSVSTLVFAQSSSPRSCMIEMTLLFLSSDECSFGSSRRLALNRRFSLTDRVPIRTSSWKCMSNSLKSLKRNHRCCSFGKKFFKNVWLHLHYQPEPHKQRRAWGLMWQLCHPPKPFLPSGQ